MRLNLYEPDKGKAVIRTHFSTHNGVVGVVSMGAQNNKDDVVYVEHMLMCIEKINEYTEGSKEKFFASSLVQDAVVRNLQVLAESSQRISDDLKNIHAEVAWRDISGFRNILVHDYLGIDCETIWSVVEQDIPSLLLALRKML